MYHEEHEEMMQCICRPANLSNVLLHVEDNNTDGRSYSFYIGKTFTK